LDIYPRDEYIDTIEDYSTLKKNKIMSFAGEKDGSGDHHAK
jgi:hypothetical protein